MAFNPHEGGVDRNAVKAPERALYMHVVVQAFRDLFSTRAQGSQLDTTEARAFLTEAEGPWAESRALVCEAAGLDPEMVRDQALHWQKHELERPSKGVGLEQLLSKASKGPKTLRRRVRAA